MTTARPAPRVVVGEAAVAPDPRRLLGRVRPGTVAIVDHSGLDRRLAERLADAGLVALVNAAACAGSIDGDGSLHLVRRGVAVVESAGAEVLDRVADGDRVSIIGGHVLVGDLRVAAGVRQDEAGLDQRTAEARLGAGVDLTGFARRALEHLERDADALAGAGLPDLGVTLRGRHALVVADDPTVLDELRTLRRGGYVADQRPYVMAVDGGADTVLEAGMTPDLVIGDLTHVPRRVLDGAAALVWHPGPDDHRDGVAVAGGRPVHRFDAPGSHTDAALVLAHGLGADLVVAAGARTSLEDLAARDDDDGGGAGLLIRLLVGDRLVDARGVGHLHRTRVRTLDLVMLVASALLTLAIIAIVSEPIRTVLRGFWLTFQ